MSKAISTEYLSDTISLSECRDGFWLYDATRGMNLAMRAKTRDDAFMEALKYYQNRLTQVESENKKLREYGLSTIDKLAELLDIELG